MGRGSQVIAATGTTSRILRTKRILGLATRRVQKAIALSGGLSI